MRLTKNGQPDGRSSRATGRTQQLATRVTEAFHTQVKEISQRDGLLLVEVLEEAVKAYERLADPSLAAALHHLEQAAAQRQANPADLMEEALVALDAPKLPPDPLDAFHALWAVADADQRLAMIRHASEGGEPKPKRVPVQQDLFG